MDENILETIDRISQLPECIVHHILSFLNSPADLVRTNVLSKKWFALTASFPILDFDIFKTAVFETFEDRKLVRDRFFKYVAYTMSRFCEQNVSAHTFKLTAAFLKPEDVKIIDRWVELIVKKDVQVLGITIHTWLSLEEPLPKYPLPNTLLSAASLTSLRICHCELPFPFNGVKFRSLKMLSLAYVRIEEKVIECLIASCPLIEELDFNLGCDFRKCCVYGLHNLQKLKICYQGRVELIDIEASNLQYLCLVDLKCRVAPCIHVASCTKLTTVSFSAYFSLAPKWFAEFMSNFPFVENLFLNLPTRCNNVKVSSRSLRKLVVPPRSDLEGIEIDAPNLLLFECSGKSNPTPFSLASISAESKACMECYLRDDDDNGVRVVVDALWFQKLRRFLDKENRFKVLKLHINADFIDVDELKVIQSPPFELEHIELNMGTMQELSVYAAAVDAVFWCCRPRNLTLTFGFSFIDFEKKSYIVKFTYEKLLQQEDQGRTSIQIALSCGSNTNGKFTNLNSLLNALPHDRQKQIISFIKEEVVQEAA